MKRKPKEKLSDRLQKLFMHSARGYGWVTRDVIFSRINAKNCDEFGKKMSEYIINMIAEYEPEDIE